MTALTLRQETFCREYILAAGNASDAYRRAYNAEKMSGPTIHVKACHLMAEDKIRTRISELQAGLQQRFEVTVDRVLQEYAKIAFLDPRKMFDAAGNLLPIHDMDVEVAAALAGFDVMTGMDGPTLVRISKVKLQSKVAALDSLAKILGMFKADNEQGKRTVIIKDFTGGGCGE